MRYTEAQLESMRQQAAIDLGAAKALEAEYSRDAKDTFGRYITVREFCNLTGASPNQVYYSIREAPVSMDAIRHGLWFIHINVAIDYADTLKARRLKRAGQLAQAAMRLEKRNERRIERAKAVAKQLDKIEAGEDTRIRPEGKVTITEAAALLGIEPTTASTRLKGVDKEKVGTFVYVPRSLVEEMRSAANNGHSHGNGHARVGQGASR